MEMEQGQFSFSKHISILYRCGQSYYDDVLREYGIVHNDGHIHNGPVPLHP